MAEIVGAVALNNYGKLDGLATVFSHQDGF